MNVNKIPDSRAGESILDERILRNVMASNLVRLLDKGMRLSDASREEYGVHNLPNF